ncbi:MAG: ATP-binding protein [Clostridiales bacterium]|jgi:AAA+ ATPase superfamily predicted ATPase|nr:ATP-binding protein [Clostridiales bacterium]
MFVGRDAELSTLNKLYREDGFQMVVLFGRRRIGKTMLIREFVKDKPAIFFTAQEINDTMNLREFSKKVYRFFDFPEGAGTFGSWIDAFHFLATKAAEKRFILAFDEFPYAVSANRALKSILQTAIDHEFLNTGLFLILCGSHMGFMENEVLGYKSPLFGRRTAQIRLAGLDYYDAGKLLGNFSNEDKIRLYACVGGTPHYLAQIKSAETFEENIKRLYFDSSGYLYNEPMMLLQQELREPAMYNSIVSAIAGGASRINEIATKIGEVGPKVSKYLSTLIRLQIVQKTFPFDETPQNSRRGVYQIADDCYAFWYRFVFPARPEIEGGSGDLTADAEVFGERLSTYIGKPPFEKICLQYLIRQNRNRKLPFTATGFGSWWGGDPREKIQTDLDVVAANRAKKQILLGECKWRRGAGDAAQLRKLMEKTYLLSGYGDRYYCLFSKTAFSKEARAMADGRVSLISTDDLFQQI